MIENNSQKSLLNSLKDIDSMSYRVNELSPYFDDAEDNSATIQDFGIHDFTHIHSQVNNFILPHSTFHIVISGKGFLSLFDKQYELSEGDSFFSPVGAHVTYHPNKKEPWRYFFITMTGENICKLFKKIGFTEINPIYHFSFNDNLLNAILNFFSKKFYNNISFYYHCESCFYNLLSTVATERKIDNNTVSIETLYDLINSFIEGNYHNPDFNVTNLCQLLNYSQSYLYKMCLNHTGKTLQTLLFSYRMEKAKKLLTTTTIKIKDIATSVGYPDCFHFSKCFKKDSGYSPSQYRENYLVKTLN